jgi:hypothetical protein
MGKTSSGDTPDLGTAVGDVNGSAVASPDLARAEILDAGDFEVEPGVLASKVLDDLADDAEFAEVVNLCGLGGRFNV